MVVHTVIPVLRRSQDGDFEASLGYKVRTQLKNKQSLAPLPSELKWMFIKQRYQNQKKKRKLSKSRDSFKTPRGSTFSREAQHPTTAVTAVRGQVHWAEDAGRQRWDSG